MNPLICCMRNRILELEKKAGGLEPSAEKRSKWNEGIQHYANDFLDALDEVPCYIKTEDPAKVFDAITTQEGLASWWTTATEATETRTAQAQVLLNPHSRRLRRARWAFAGGKV